MSRGGLAKDRLGRMRDVMTKHVESGGVPGLITLVSRRGDVHVEAIGPKALGARDPMQRDTIVRITSMTKPVTAVAAMILVEECAIRLDEPVDRLLPELADRRVLSRFDGPLDQTVPARRPITVRDLLTFRMGFGFTMATAEHHPIVQAEREQRLMTLGPPTPPTPHDPDEWMRRLGTLPLMDQPGNAWLYGTGSHVLGVLISRAAGKPLETFLRDRIFEPLGMKDTSFSVPAAKLDRLAACYRPDPATRGLALHDGVPTASGAGRRSFPTGERAWSRPSTITSRSAGCCSTRGGRDASGSCRGRRSRR